MRGGTAIEDHMRRHADGDVELRIKNVAGGSTSRGQASTGEDDEPHRRKQRQPLDDPRRAAVRRSAACAIPRCMPPNTTPWKGVTDHQ